MAKFCTCDATIIAKFGYSMVAGKMVCKNCGLPDIESTPTSVSSTRKTGEEAVEGDFLKNLFDLKIDNYISVKFSRFIYGFSIAIYAILCLAILIYSWVASGGQGEWAILGTLFAVALFFILTIFARLSVELIVVIFQIARDIRTIAGQR